MADDQERPTGIFSSIYDTLKRIGHLPERALGTATDILGEPLTEALIGGALGASGVGYGPYNENATPFWQNRERVHQQRAMAQLLGQTQTTPEQRALMQMGVDPMKVIQAGQPQYKLGAGGAIAQFPAELGGQGPPSIVVPPVTAQRPLSVPAGGSVWVPGQGYVTPPAGVSTPPKPFSVAPGASVYTGQGFQTPPGAAGMPPVKGDKRTSQLADKVYVDERGNPAPDMWESEAPKQGYRAVKPAMIDKIQATRQGLQLLSNMANVFDNLNAKGKMLTKTGIGALGQRARLSYKGWTGDPDLTLAGGQTSEMVASLRTLGDKGVRAIKAFEGALNIIESGGAPYETVKKYLQQMDTAIRVPPSTVPKAYDDTPGATEMGIPPALRRPREPAAAAPPTGANIVKYDVQFSDQEMRLIDSLPDGKTIKVDGRVYQKQGKELVPVQ